jgi:hypothetical protein
MREEIERKEKDARKLREQLSAECQRYKAEIEAIKLEKQKELDLIEAKIKEALGRKHEVIA